MELNERLCVVAATLPIRFPDEDDFWAYRGKEVTVNYDRRGIRVDGKELTGKARTYAKKWIEEFPL